MVLAPNYLITPTVIKEHSNPQNMKISLLGCMGSKEWIRDPKLSLWIDAIVP